MQLAVYRTAPQQVHVLKAGKQRQFLPFMTTNLLFGGLDEDNLLYLFRNYHLLQNFNNMLYMKLSFSL